MIPMKETPMPTPRPGSPFTCFARAWRAARSVAIGTALLGLLGACVSAPEAEDYLAMGHRDPEQTFKTFQTALAADLPLEEYLCFSEGFLERQSISRQAYLKGRSDLLRDHPWARLLAEAEIKESRRLDAEHHLIRAVASGPFGIGRTELVVILIPNYYYQIDGSTPDGRPLRIYDEFLPEGLEANIGAQPAENPRYTRVWGIIDVPREGIEASEIRDFHVGTSWKIDSMEQVEEEDTDEPDDPTDPPTGSSEPEA